MAQRVHVPDASVYRLALYHCYLDEIVYANGPERITSRQLAEALEVKEETVRRDISFVGEIGRPGAGYDSGELLEALTEFLGFGEEYPTVRVGSEEMLRALKVVFPPAQHGVKPVAYFSERPEDAGKVLDDLTIHYITDIPELVPNAGAKVAVIGTTQEWAQITIDMLANAGVTGMLLLTPRVVVRKPKDVVFTQIRMPCEIKSLACRVRLPSRGETFE